MDILENRRLPLSWAVRFHDFTSPYKNGRFQPTYNVIDQSHLEAEEDSPNHVRLAVPDPPVGLAEFALARYLYVQTCDVITKRPSFPVLDE